MAVENNEALFVGWKLAHAFLANIWNQGINRLCNI